jgi:hypothetical protein
VLGEFEAKSEIQKKDPKTENVMKDILKQINPTTFASRGKIFRKSFKRA